MSKEVKKDEVVKAVETVAEDYSQWSLMQKLYRIQKEKSSSCHFSNGIR